MYMFRKIDAYSIQKDKNMLCSKKLHRKMLVVQAPKQFLSLSFIMTHKSIVRFGFGKFIEIKVIIALIDSLRLMLKAGKNAHYTSHNLLGR